ncbi:MAG: caspase family protein, partial [Planctomycetes bacterium]|nr:caspase family protein [Planctomycetota bacterium]
RDCEISLIAENKHAASVPANVRVHWHGRMAEFVIQPKLYVLAVGVGQYEDASLRLEFAAKDARDFAEAMRRQQGGLYRHVECKLLADAQAAKGDILDGLEWIQRQTTSKDVAAIFLAGHGINDDSGFYYFAPVDFQRERVKRTAVPWSEVKGTVESLAGKVLFFVDTCHAGAVMGPKRRDTADFTRIINELASAESGAVVFAASTGRQASLEDPAWNNGAFTRAVVEGLEGKADYHRSGRITINMLDLYISERVKELTQGRQTPTTTKPQTIPDFPVALTR